MVRISKEKINKIKSNILATLYQHFPKALFTAEISKIEARDEEFMKRLLLELEHDGLVVLIDKNPDGIPYSRRQRWRLSNKAQEAYSKQQ